MRIALVSLHTSPAETPGQGDAGGMNVVVREAALALERLGHEVAVITRASKTQSRGSAPLTPGSTVLVHALDVGKPGATKTELVQLLPDLSATLQNHPAMRDADVVHAHYWLSGVAALPVTHDRGIPLVTSLHTVAAQKNAHLAPGDTPEPQARLDGERELTRRSVLVAGSLSEFEAVHAGYGAPYPASRVVHPGVDTALFRPHSHDDEATATGDRFTITVLGRVQPLKGQDLALEAFIAFRERYPHLASGSLLTIAGEPTPGAEAYYDALTHRATHLGTAVRFLPAQSRGDAARLLRASELVLVPSHSETFGLVALEAAASGVPVIAHRTSGLTEAVHEGESGVLVEGRDPLDWAEAIAQFARQPAILARFRGTARTFALRHSWDAHASSLVALYCELTGATNR